jgi:hypothetical protein
MGKITDWLKEAPTLAVAHERLALAETKLADLEKENEKLRKENLALFARLQESPQRAYTEAHGVLWKRTASGGHEALAYCPTCKLALATFPPGSNEMLVCSKCDWQAPFRPNEIKGLLKSLV